MLQALQQNRRDFVLTQLPPALAQCEQLEWLRIQKNNLGQFTRLVEALEQSAQQSLTSLSGPKQLQYLLEWQ